MSNVAISRLTQTWEKLHNKVKRIFTQYESLIDSSRNYRRYRLLLSKFDPPLVPFVPLLIKDMTILHEGNKTFVDQGLVNFEKMVKQFLNSMHFNDLCLSFLASFSTNITYDTGL